MRIPVSCAGRTPPPLRQALGIKILFVLSRTWEWEGYRAKRKAAEVTDDFVVRTQTKLGRGILQAEALGIALCWAIKC